MTSALNMTERLSIGNKRRFSDKIRFSNKMSFSFSNGKIIKLTHDIIKYKLQGGFY